MVSMVSEIMVKLWISWGIQILVSDW